MKTLTVKERQDYGAALLEELKRLHTEFDENIFKAEGAPASKPLPQGIP